MSRQSSVNTRFHNGSTNSALVLVSLGGSKAVLLHHMGMWYPDYCLGIDVPHELPDEDVIRRQCRKVKLFALGAGQTADTLFATADPEQRALVQSLAGMDAANGLGQVRGIGAQAMRDLLETVDWERTKREMVDELLIACNGTVQQVVARLIGGSCGGTASAALKLLGDDLAQTLATTLGANVHVNFDVTGMISYLSLGDRIGKNAAAAIVEIADSVVHKAPDTRITRSLALVEYPPFRRDKAKRDEHVLLDEQALASRQVQEALNRIAPNRSLNGPFGNITWRTVDYFTPLDPHTVIAKTVADAYSAALQTLLNHAVPDPQRVQSIRLIERVHALPRQEIATIADNAMEESFENLVNAITQSGGEIQAAPVAQMATGESLPLSTAESHWALSPQSPEEAVDRLIIQGAICDALTRRAAEFEQELIQVERKMARAEQKLARVHDLLQGKRFVDRVRSIATSADSLLADFEDRATDLRAAADQHQGIEARLSAIREAIGLIGAEQNHLRQYIRWIIETIRQHSPPMAGEGAEPEIVVKPLGMVWPSLWNLPTLPHTEQLRVIKASVASVTVAGLARITRADPPRLDAIAERIAEGKVATQGPPWGGRSQSDEGVVIIVLPPSAPHVATSLRRLITDRSPSTIVASADTAEVGVNILRVTIHGIRDVEELLPAPLAHGLSEALHDPLKRLFLPSGEGALDRLGIDGRNGQLVFHVHQKQ